MRHNGEAGWSSADVKLAQTLNRLLATSRRFHPPGLASMARGCLRHELCPPGGEIIAVREERSALPA